MRKLRYVGTPSPPCVQAMSSDAQLAKAKLALLVKCAQWSQSLAQLSSPDDVAEAEMCLDEWIERCNDKLANPTTSQESCTKLFEDSQAQYDGYDSDATTNSDPVLLSSSFRPVQQPFGETRDTESPWSPSFIRRAS